MRVLVTGCGGFVGAEITRQLLDRGDLVVGVSRREYPALVAAGMEHRRGDLTDRDFVEDAISDVDAVVHTAAIAGVWGPWERYFQTNVRATDFVIDRCRRAGIGSLVYTSSPSVTFGGQDQSGIDESAPYPVRPLCHYGHTKAIAEANVLAADQIDGLRTLALRPHLVWGEDDPHLLPRIVDRARAGRLRVVGDGDNRIDTVHVVNAAAAHLDALDALRRAPDRCAGRAYFIAQDEPVACWPWIAKICEIYGVDPPTKRISLAAASRVGWLLESVYATLRIRAEPPMTRFVAAQLARDHYFDISAARKRLGYRVRLSMEEGLDRLRESVRRRSE